MRKKDWFTIPNLMGYFRILLIPVFLVLYAKADAGSGYFPAFFVLALSYLSDFLDGKIARKFHMVTDLGKVLDPVADKLTQGALALALCLRYPLMVWFVLLFCIKELYMAAAGLFLIRRQKGVKGAQRFGKFCTAAVDAGIFVLLLFPNLPLLVTNLLILFMMAVMLVTLVRYVVFHLGELGIKSPLHIKRWQKRAFLVFALLYVLLGGTLPYAKTPEISEAYAGAFDVQSFYGDTVSCDRAALIEDNGEALAERIRIIENAKERIVLSTFDFRADTSGKQVLAALRAAAGRGVQVEVLMDGVYALLHMEGDPYFYALSSQENVTLKIYNPVNLLTPWKGMSRMHDKYLVADEEVYLLGGRNTFDYFLGNQEGHKNHDRDVLIWNTGGVDSSVYQVLGYFESVWTKDCCRAWHDGGWTAHLPAVRRAARELDALYETMRQEHADWFAPADYEKMTVSTDKVTLLANPTDLYAKEPQVFYGLAQLMKEARSEVIIHTPYIICDEMMYETYAQVCSGEAKVTLMTNSAANNGNSFGAVDYVLNKQKILDTGLNVLEYEGGVSYHGKSVVIDGELAIVGSFNADMKSVYQDTELMLVVNSRELGARLKENLEEYHKDAKPAQVREEETDFLAQEGESLGLRLFRFVLAKLDPWIRFLL